MVFLISNFCSNTCTSTAKQDHSYHFDPSRMALSCLDDPSYEFALHLVALNCEHLMDQFISLLPKIIGLRIPENSFSKVMLS